MNILREVDHVILGLPMLSCMAAGAAGGFIQQSSYAPVKAAGWLGVHSAIILGVVCGVPLLIYSLAKVIFANALNVATLEHFDCIKDFKEHAELQFTVTLVTVSALPVIILALPRTIPVAYESYQKYQELKEAYDEFTKSDLYNTLKTIYEGVSKILAARSGGASGDDHDALESI